RDGRIATWGEFLTTFTRELKSARADRGAGLAILTETITSPSLADQLERLLAELPESRWYRYEPVNRDNVKAGARLALGEGVDTIYRFDRAEVVLTLDADFLTHIPGNLRYAREFIDGRRVVGGRSDPGTPLTMNRLYAIESTPGLAGAVAD